MATLELLDLLDSVWCLDPQLQSKFEVCWINALGEDILTEARSRIEWVGKRLQERFHEEIGADKTQLSE